MLDVGRSHLYYVIVNLTFTDKSNIAVKWLAFLLRIREFPGSNFGPQIGASDLGLLEFSQHLQVNYKIVASSKPYHPLSRIAGNLLNQQS
jgi:hypothetical protein